MCSRRKCTLVGIGLTMSIILGLTAALVMSGCSSKGNPAIPPLNETPQAAQNTRQIRPTLSHLGNPATSAPATRPSSKKWADNEVQVVPRKGISVTQLGSALSAMPLKIKRTIPCRWGTIYVMTITDSTPVPDMVGKLRTNPLIWMAEPNYIYHYTEAPYWPNDPMWDSDDPGTDPRDNMYDNWGPAKIGASVVWNGMKGSSDVIVAVIDTGINRDHEDLHDNIWVNTDEIPDNGIDDDNNGWVDDTWGWDCALENNNPTDQGYYGYYHGSACAGVVAAVQDNNIGLTGTAPGVKVMALRIDFGYDIYESAVSEAIHYAQVNGASICSMSFGGGEYSQILETVMNDAWDNGDGMILCASAGNDDSDQVGYPSKFLSVLTVGATVPFANDGTPVDEERINSTDYLGYYWGSNYGTDLDVMGFGEKYISTNGEGTNTYYDGQNGHEFFGGTSCACPMTAAVMALIKSKFPEKNGQWCWDRICETADDLGALGKDIQTGNGRVDALRAVYGSDRFADQEDTNGFVPMVLPDSKLFDTIHDVTNNPYYDQEDLYKFTATTGDLIVVGLDIFTWGEDLDLAVYSDVAMTQLVQDSTGPNHAGSSTEEVSFNGIPGQDYFVKVYSPAKGNSTVYGISVHQYSNDLLVTGESLAPQFIHQQGQNVPFLRLQFEIGSQTTLSELIVNKHGTLPNEKWIDARLYKDTNGNGVVDSNDELVAEKFPQARNRVRFDSLNLQFDYHGPLMLLFTADFAKTLDESTVSFSLETYKDVTTVEGYVAGYAQFPISSDALIVGTDTTPPTWDTTVGMQFADGLYKMAKIGWNGATDLQTPPVKYNVYWTDTLPFDVGAATKIPDVKPIQGTSTQYQCYIPNLPGDKLLYFVVRAEDQVGNEDTNLVVRNTTTSSGGNPSEPIILGSFDVYFPYKVSISGNLLAVADTYDGLKIFDRSDPINLVFDSSWAGDDVYSVVVDGNFAYCGGYDYFSVIDLTNPKSPKLADSFSCYDSYAVGKAGNWAYVASSYDTTLFPVDVTDPYNIKPGSAVGLGGSGYGYDIRLTPDYMYVGYTYEGIISLKLITPSNPTYSATFGPTTTTALEIGGSTLYSTNVDVGSLLSYDLSANPSIPPQLDNNSQGSGNQGSALVLLGQYAYVGRPDWGIVTFDIADPSDIKLVGGLKVDGIQYMVTDGVIIYAVAVDQSYYGHLYVII